MRRERMKLEPLMQEEIDAIADMFPTLEVKYDEEEWKDAAKEWWKAKYKIKVKEMREEE